MAQALRHGDGRARQGSGQAHACVNSAMRRKPRDERPGASPEAADAVAPRKGRLRPTAGPLARPTARAPQRPNARPTVRLLGVLRSGVLL